MALPIIPEIFDITVNLMAMSIAEVGASVGKLLEVGGLDWMELGIRETTWSGCLCKTIARGFPTARMVITTKPASPTASFFKYLYHDWFISSCFPY